MIAILSCERPLHFFDSEFGSKIDPFGEDKQLIAAFHSRGIEAQRVAWDKKGVDWNGFDAVIVRSTWDYFVQCEKFLNAIESIAAVTSLWNGASTIRWNADKRYLAELEGRGVEIVPTVFVPDLTVGRAYDVARAECWARFVVKPVIGGGAMETFRLPHDEKLFRQFNPGHCRDFMVQPYLPAIEGEGEWSFLFFGGEFQFAIQKIPRSGDYRVQGIWGATIQAKAPHPDDLRVATNVLSHLDAPTLYARVDMVRGEGGRLLLMELELIEPYLSLSLHAGSAVAFVEAFQRMPQR